MSLWIVFNHQVATSEAHQTGEDHLQMLLGAGKPWAPGVRDPSGPAFMQPIRRLEHGLVFEFFSVVAKWLNVMTGWEHPGYESLRPCHNSGAWG